MVDTLPSRLVNGGRPGNRRLAICHHVVDAEAKILGLVIKYVYATELKSVLRIDDCNA